MLVIAGTAATCEQVGGRRTPSGIRRPPPLPPSFPHSLPPFLSPTLARSLPPPSLLLQPLPFLTAAQTLPFADAPFLPPSLPPSLEPIPFSLPPWVLRSDPGQGWVTGAEGVSGQGGCARLCHVELWLRLVATVCTGGHCHLATCVRGHGGWASRAQSFGTARAPKANYAPWPPHRSYTDA